MPRLVGNRSSTGANITILIIIIAIFGVLLEYLGVVDIIPGFGRERLYFQRKNQLNNEQVTEQLN